MSASSQTTTGSSTDNFTAVFNAVSAEYQMATGSSLDTHPFATQLGTGNSPEVVSNILRTRTEVFSKFRKSDEKRMAWLDPIVHILFVMESVW
jgi:hypothetical protein